MTKILLVEDEVGLADSLQTEFELEDMQVTWVADGAAAITTFAAEPFDLVILDWMLPKLDGFSVLQRLRKTSQVPVIMLTARDYIGDKVAGLTGGADDYITKPFEMAELLARVELALRHSGAKPAASTYTVADLVVDTASKRVTRGSTIIALTQREYDLLVALIAQANTPVPRDALLDAVWGRDFDGQPNILDVYIKNLRGKIDADPRGLKLIHTVRGVGYMLAAHVQN